MEGKLTRIGIKWIGLSLYQSVRYIVHGIIVQSDVIVIKREAIAFITNPLFALLHIRLI